MVLCSNPVREKNFFSSRKCLDFLIVPTNLLFSGYRDSFPEVKRPGYEVNHSVAASAEVKDDWKYASTPLCVPSWYSQGKLPLIVTLKFLMSTQRRHVWV
jgi:hypothetical protein